jgi:hypothetical protein
MNDMKLQDVMTTNEASYRWNINESTLRMRIKNSPIIDELKTQGLIKYFLKPGNKRGEYLFTVEAMERLYGKEKKSNRKPSAPTKTARTFLNIIFHSERMTNMSNALQIKNDEAIISHSERPQQTPQTPKDKLLTKYHALCEWFGIDGCKESQLYFFGTFLATIILFTIMYVMGGVCYGF